MQNLSRLFSLSFLTIAMMSNSNGNALELPLNAKNTQNDGKIEHSENEIQNSDKLNEVSNLNTNESVKEFGIRKANEAYKWAAQDPLWRVGVPLFTVAVGAGGVYYYYAGEATAVVAVAATNSAAMAYQRSQMKFKKQPSAIAKLVAFLSKADVTDFIAKNADAPFRGTSNVEQIISLDSLFEGNTLNGLADILPQLRDQLPNLLKKYVNDSNYLFGSNSEVDAQMVSIIKAIIDSGNSFKSFEHFAIAFPAVKKLASLFYAQKFIQSCRD